jgi:NSS family neurotransmitter:Na+ symporter
VNTPSKKRDVWGSKIGFVLAAAGSAIGLGNIWRFPYVTGENGGAAFVLLYIIFIVLIGVPVMLSELTIGRHAQRNPVGAFRKIAPKSLWPLVGLMGVVTGIGILSYYSVIAGWTFGYFIKALSGNFSNLTSAEQSSQIFTEFVKNPYQCIAYLFVFLTATGFVVLGGISGGIEKWAKILMPLLFILLLLLTLRSVTLPNAKAGLEFYLAPDFGKINAGTIASALGQALFSLSLGMGAMITYGSYISKKDNLAISAGCVCLFDTLIAVVSGLMIFPALFSMGLDPSGGPGLVFVVLPSIFDKMPGGIFFGAGFFLLLTVAALTSTISLLEVAVTYFVDEFNWQRRRAVVLMSGLAFVLGIPSALSQGANSLLSNLPLVHLGFLDFANILLGNYSLTIGALLLAIFVGYKWGIKNLTAEITIENNHFYGRSFWGIIIRYFCPVAIIVILLYILLTGNYF